MIKISTLNNPPSQQQHALILSIYGELPDHQRNDLNIALSLDADLSEDHQLYLESRNQVNSLLEEPDDVAIENILRYSQSFAHLG